MTTHAEAIARLRDTWSRQDFSDREVLIYGERLGRFPADEVMAAVNDLIDTCKFRPSVGEVCERIAERALNLPTVEEAWEIAERGIPRLAPEPVRRACDYVGGRWAILNTDNLVALRAQFRQAYAGYRQAALSDYLLGERPELHAPTLLQLGPTMADLPVTDHVRPRPVMNRLMERWAGHELAPPTEEEKADAIEVLREGTWANGPENDPLYSEAERVFGEAAS